MEQLETLGQFEGLILTAIKRLKDDAYGMQIYGEICRMADRDVNLGSMYVTLERLKKKGYVKYKVERGGPARRGKLCAGKQFLPEMLPRHFRKFT